MSEPNNQREREAFMERLKVAGLNLEREDTRDLYNGIADYWIKRLEAREQELRESLLKQFDDMKPWGRVCEGNHPSPFTVWTCNTCTENKGYNTRINEEKEFIKSLRGNQEN